MTVKLLTEKHLEFLSLKGGFAGSSEHIHVKIPHCWKSHVAAQIYSVVSSGSEGKTVYATVRSDCTGPLEGVQFTSTELISVNSNLPGSYKLKVCTLPTDITTQKDGFEPVTQTVTRTSMSVQMTCPGTYRYCPASQE